MAHNAKTERNNKIKDLFFREKLSQFQIGEMFGLDQSRVSAICHDWRPKYRCCLFCRAHITGHSVCAECRNRRRNERLARTLLKRVERDQVRGLHKDVFAVVSNVRRNFRAARRESIFIDRKIKSIVRV